MFVVPDLAIGGAERHLVTLAPRLDRTRFKASVVCIGDEGGLFDILGQAGIPASALHLSGKRHAFAALRALVTVMRKERPELVVLRGYNAEALGRIAAFSAGVRRTIVWVHSSENIKPRSWLRNFAEIFLSRRTTRFFGVAEAQTPYLVHELNYPSERVRIIHNGVEVGQFDTEADHRLRGEFGIRPGSAVVGIIAGLRPEKDHRTLLYAMQLLIRDLPNVDLLVVGDGALRDELESLSHRLGIRQNVHFIGARNDIPEVLRAIDVFTLTSTTECLPISVLEAMASGRPTVCTDVGGISEMVTDGITGYLVPPGDATLLARRLKGLLSDPEAAQRMGLAGRRRVETDFSLERSVAATERAFEDAVHQRP